jgi:biotin carboxyl carrier protein
MEAIQPQDHYESAPEPDESPQGEFVFLGEALIVSPTWGKFRRATLQDDCVVEIGAVVGHVHVDGPTPHEVRSTVHGTFLGWMAWDGEKVGPGTPIARISPNGKA